MIIEVLRLHLKDTILSVCVGLEDYNASGPTVSLRASGNKLSNKAPKSKTTKEVWVRKRAMPSVCIGSSPKSGALR